MMNQPQKWQYKSKQAYDDAMTKYASELEARVKEIQKNDPYFGSKQAYDESMMKNKSRFEESKKLDIKPVTKANEQTLREIDSFFNPTKVEKKSERPHRYMTKAAKKYIAENEEKQDIFRKCKCNCCPCECHKILSIPIEKKKYSRPYMSKDDYKKMMNAKKKEAKAELNFS